MSKPIILATVLLASTAAGGAALAAGHFARFGHEAADRSPSVRADEDRADVRRVSERDRDRHYERRHRREHHHDDDDDDDHHERHRGGDRRHGSAPAPTGPADPTAPVPDNGLFGGKARPKVEVQ